MLDWVKIESNFVNDSRIKALLTEYGFVGLGIYLSIRIAIESINKFGIPLSQAIAVCQPLARRNKIMRIIDEFGLFCISDFGIITVEPLEVSSPAHTSAHTPAYMPAQTSAHNQIVENIEENRKEEKRISFRKPTLDEVSAYCQERHNSIDPQAFIDFYESKGWKVGSSAMKDWKAAIRTWEHKRNQSIQSEHNGHPLSPGHPAEQSAPYPPAERSVPEQSTNPPIPANAPPKPSPNAHWDFATDSWNEFY